MESNSEESREADSDVEESESSSEDAGRFLIFLKVSCPACGARGAIRWDKLNSVHVCRRCSRFVGVNRSGGPVEVIRAKDNRWVTKEVHAARSTRARVRRFFTRCLLPVLGVAVAILLTLRLSSRPLALPDVELPRELKPRAELLTKAWLKRGWSQMRLLVRPGEDRNLYRWSVRSPPPTGEPKVGQSEGELTVDATVLSVQPQAAQVRVQIRGLPGTSAKDPLELLQLWEDRGGSWFFIVPTQTTSAKAPRGTSKSKQPIKRRVRSR
jgi:hypothetical protein